MSFGSKSLPAATADEARRMDKARERGCICCLIRLGVQTPPEIHHLLIGGRRAGHRYTVALCSWHHRAAPLYGESKAHARALYGPSLAEGSKPFHDAFESDDSLLRYQDRLIGWPVTELGARSKVLR